MPIKVFLHSLVGHIGIIWVVNHCLDPVVVSLVELKLSQGLLLLLGDSFEFGAHLVQASLKGAVVDCHGLDAVAVELGSGVGTGELGQRVCGRQGIYTGRDEIVGYCHRLNQVITAG